MRLRDDGIIATPVWSDPPGGRRVESRRIGPVRLKHAISDTSGAGDKGKSSCKPDTFEYLVAIDAARVMLELSPRTGFNGVFAFPAAGGHLMTREGEDWALYRWTGLAP